MLRTNRRPIRIALRCKSPLNCVNVLGADEYVDADDKTIPEDDGEIYTDPSTVNNVTLNDSTTSAKTEECPYSKTPASELSSFSIRNGELFIKEKFMFFGLQKKKLHAVVKDGWLLVYSGEKAVKPSKMFDLVDYKVRTFDNMADKRIGDFELVNLTNAKTFQVSIKTVERLYVKLIYRG